MLADLNFRWAHMSEGTFSEVAVLTVSGAQENYPYVICGHPTPKSTCASRSPNYYYSSIILRYLVEYICTLAAKIMNRFCEFAG